MPVAVGIDLGTTNSVIAATVDGQATVIPNAEGSRTTPSVVAFTPQGERLVGQIARRQAILNPKGTIYSAKRFIGRHYDEVASEVNAVSFDVVPGPDGAVRFKVQDRELVITGEIPDSEQKGRRHRRSRRTGRFEFHTYLPGDLNADSVNAQLSDGVLTVTVPKAEKAKPRHIEIKG